MSDDLLERATSALRETTSDPAHDLERARQRAKLLQRARKQSSFRPQTLWQWAAVLLLGCFVSTAMAHVISVQGPRLLRALRSQAPAASAAQPGKSGRPRKLTAPAARAAQPTVDAAPTAPAPQGPTLAPPPAAGTAPTPPQPAPAALSRSARPAPAPARHAPRTIAQPAAPARARPVPAESGAVEPAPKPVATAQPSAAPEPAELALFRTAQALHLAHDARAIEAWDAYLRAASAPSQRALVPEAKYNRALGLIRASRYAEARSALTPFALGAFAGFRQREAQALLARLPE